MFYFTKTKEDRIKDKNPKIESGLQNLVAHYQDLFDRDENINHYSPEDYQNAKRKFVKYLLQNREILQ
jgi:hypothetical protein